MCAERAHLVTSSLLFSYFQIKFVIMSFMQMARYKRLVAQMVNSEPKHAVMLQTVKADQVADTAEVSADKRKDKLDEVQSEE